MSELPYRPEHVADSIADSDDLSNEELGAFIRITRALWRSGGFMPVDKLPRFARATKRRWRRLGPIILDKLTIHDGIASCQSVLVMMQASRERQRAASERARAGAAAKWGKVGAQKSTQKRPFETTNPLKTLNRPMLEALPKHSSSSANQNQNLESSFTDSQSGDVYGACIKILVERVGVKATQARIQTAKWVNAVGYECELAAVVSAVQETDLRGAQLVAVIDQRIAVRQRELEKGGMLPFPPKGLSRTA